MTTDMSQDSIDLLCSKCGQTFSAFLHQMADQNEKVVCPNCRENSDCRPSQTPKPMEETRPVKRAN
jgi:hypothetical protein